MSDQLIEKIEKNIVNQIADQVPYLQSADNSRCRGVADVRTALSFDDVIAPAALVQYMGSRVHNEGTVGLPVARQVDFSWRVYLLSSSFSHSGEGRLGEAPIAGAQGAYQLVDDVFIALQGFQVDDAYDARLLYKGDNYDMVLDGRVLYVSDWMHWTRRVGVIVR